jgi:spermidine synthase
LLLFYALTLFVSAGLLFLIEPMFAKMVLPLLGGTPAVWNTCMVFFQAALLAGYAYSHAATARLGVRRQAAFHFVLLLLPLAVLPIAVPKDWTPWREANPLPWLLLLLTVAVGLPFFVVATAGPLLQKWFAGTGHPAARDPYFLYSASNLGSMLALLAYPVLLEPNLRLKEQSQLWSAGYLLLIVLTAGCSILLWRSRQAAGSGHKEKEFRSQKSEGRGQKSQIRGRKAEGGEPAVTSLPIVHYSLATTLRWVILAFVPSSLMLSVTTYLTTDIAAIPLLWIIPLAIYLLSFILVFARRPPVPQFLMVRLMPLLILLLTLVMLSVATEPVWLLIPIHLLTFFVVAMVCHGELARLRPPAGYLTQFYLWLAVGGVLGGLFNALVAPLVFNAIIEYPLVLVLACHLRPRLIPEEEGERKPGKGKNQVTVPSSSAASSFSRFPWSRDLAFAVGLGLMTAGLVLGVQAFGWEHGPKSVGLMFGLPAALCYTFLDRPVRFGLGIGALFLAGALYQGVYGGTIDRERSFFGVHRITLDTTGTQHLLVHGNTVHGRQIMLPEPVDEPLTYYHRSGPIGQVFTALSGPAAKAEVAIVGLGAGSLAAYGETGQHFTYYEIDPTVKRIAEDPRYFTFLRDCKANVTVVLGDARLTLRDALDRQYGLIVMDAFSSDAIPLHLLTREALAMYASKLADDGVLAFHVSNRYLVLQPILADLAHDAHLLCWGQNDVELTEDEKRLGKSPSQWVLMAHKRADLGKLARDARWVQLAARPGVPVWTDDFSNLFSVFKWD